MYKFRRRITRKATVLEEPKPVQQGTGIPVKPQPTQTAQPAQPVSTAKIDAQDKVKKFINFKI